MQILRKVWLQVQVYISSHMYEVLFPIITTMNIIIINGKSDLIL